MKIKIFLKQNIYYIILIVVFFIMRIFEVFNISNFNSSIITLSNIYYKNIFLLNSGNINPLLTKTIIAPFNATLIIPPGTYFLNYLFQTVQNLNILLFTIQLFIPICIFIFLKNNGVTKIYSTIFSILIIFFCTSIIWHPDFIIQPLMCIILTYILYKKETIKYYDLILIGISVSIIITLKHNIGFSFLLVCLTIIFFNRIEFIKDESIRKNKYFPYFIIFLYLCFGFLFLLKFIYFDEIIFFLASYFIFWFYIFFLFFRNKLICNDLILFKESSIFIISSIILPIVLFITVGKTIGFNNYFYVLFQMGFDNLKFWDFGIIGILQAYFKFGSLSNIFTSTIYIFFLILPFLTNLISLYLVYKNRKNKNILLFTGIGILSIFMYFPLEDHKIAITKAFIYIYILCIYKLFFNSFFKKTLKYITLFILSFVFYFTLKNYSIYKHYKFVKPTFDNNNILKININSIINKELEFQVNLLNKYVSNKKFYILTSDKNNQLFLLRLFVKNQIQQQFYTRINQETYNQIYYNVIYNEINSSDFIIIPIDDYYSFKKINNFYYKLYHTSLENYKIVAKYILPISKDNTTTGMSSFYILQKRLN
jgi:hypothetical protein